MSRGLQHPSDQPTLQEQLDEIREDYAEVVAEISRLEEELRGLDEEGDSYAAVAGGIEEELRQLEQRKHELADQEAKLIGAD